MHNTTIAPAGAQDANAKANGFVGAGYMVGAVFLIVALMVLIGKASEKARTPDEWELDD